MFLFLAWSDFSLPATFSLVASSLPSGKHAMGIGMQSLIRRIPVIAGPIAGGILIDRMGIVRGVRTGAAVSIVLALFAGLLLIRLVRRSVEPASLHGFRRIVAGFTPELKRLLFSDILIRFCERLPFAWIVIYAMDQGMKARDVGVLTAIEMVAAIACYVRHRCLPIAMGKSRSCRHVRDVYHPPACSCRFAHLSTIRSCVRRTRTQGICEPARKSLIVSYSPPLPRRTVEPTI